ncbi:hypothetical protein EV121DRAFT_282396 [Schizophyllum commune]|nr:hypothetical protein K525DRAFT_286098 [Schizophyllum commune Loenen D]
MSDVEPTVELLKEYKEQLMAAAAARDKRSALGLAVGRLRDHETAEVSEKAKALVARWVAAAPKKKRQESPSKTMQISQKGAGVRDFVRQSTFEHGSRADVRKLARTDSGKTKTSASASISARSVSRASNDMTVDDAPTGKTEPSTKSNKPSLLKPTKPSGRSFETDDLGDACGLHDVPLRALTIELIYDALVAGAGSTPARSILPKAMSIEDAIYLGTGPDAGEDAGGAHADKDARTAHAGEDARNAHTDKYVRCAHAAFIALSSASDISTMRSDLLAGSIRAEDFVDCVLREEDQVM